MAGNQKQFTIGDRTFTMYTLQPFAATQHAMKLKKIMEKGLTNGMDSNVVSLMAQIDEKTLTDVIFPILKACAVTCISSERKIASEKDMDEEYSIEDMDEFFLMVWEVLKANFGPFFKKVAKNLFGFDADLWDKEKIQAVLKNLLEAVKNPPANSAK